MSHDGRGITRCDGKTVFITGALPGEEVLFEYQKKRGSFDEAIATSILTPSPERQKPKCSHFGICGGCSLQHLSTEGQREHKQKVLLELLKYQAHAEPQELLPPITANAWGYRNKARLGVRYVAGKNKVLVGFREKNTRYLTDLVRCEILHPSVGEHLSDLSALLYQLETRDQIAQIEIAVDETDTALIIRHLTALPNNDIEKLMTFAQQFHFKLYLQPEGIDSIHLINPANANELMRYSITHENIELFYHPVQFTQINPVVNQQMIALAIELLALEPTDTVLDLFCGIGNFTLPIARHVLSIVGVEGDASAIQQAIHNSHHNKIVTSEFYCENLFSPPFNPHWARRQYAKLLLDPPRAGAKEVIERLSVWQPRAIVYISCNPTTLARDTGLLLKQGYKLMKAGIIDMFPHTQHAEAIALFKK